MTVKQAKKEVEAAGFKLKEGKEVYSNDYSKGQIAEQDPESGSKAKKGSSITVHVSKGPQAGTVPNLVGHNESEAEEMLKSSDYELGTIKQQTSTEAAAPSFPRIRAAARSRSRHSGEHRGQRRKGRSEVHCAVHYRTNPDRGEAGAPKCGLQGRQGNLRGKQCIRQRLRNVAAVCGKYRAEQGTKIDIEVSKGAPKTNDNKKPNKKPSNTDSDDNGSNSVDD